MLSYLDQDITYLKGVGPHRAQLFQSQLGITTVRDLLHTYPFRHEDRTKIHRIAEYRRRDAEYTASRAHRYDTKSG